MAKTNAQRQAAYRARHLKDIDGTGERVDLLVNTSTKRALERLAKRYTVTQRAIIEKLIADAERALIDSMTPDQQARYYDPTLKPVKTVTG